MNASIATGASSTSNEVLPKLLTLSEAAKRLPRSNGRRVHSSTLWRWCRRGCKGVTLQYLRVGRTIMVSETALHAFFAALAAADSVPAATHHHVPTVRNRRPRQNAGASRQQAVDDANDILLRAGILKPQSTTIERFSKNGF